MIAIQNKAFTFNRTPSVSWLAFGVVDFCCVFTKSSSVVGWRCAGLFVYLFIGVLKPGVPIHCLSIGVFVPEQLQAFFDVLVCTNPLHGHTCDIINTVL